MRVKKAYLKAVVRTLPRGFYLRSYVLRDLARSIDFLLVCQPDADLAALETEFGKPEEYALGMMGQEDFARLLHRARIRLIIACAVCAVGIATLITALVFKFFYVQVEYIYVRGTEITTFKKGEFHFHGF